MLKYILPFVFRNIPNKNDNRLKTADDVTMAVTDPFLDLAQLHAAS